MKKICIIPLTLWILILLSANSSKGDFITDIQLIEMLMQNYGKDLVIETILEKREGHLTVLKADGLVESSGTPNPQHVTPQTILVDLKKIESSARIFELMVEDRHLKWRQKTQSKQAQN